jgi:hypothetical protein
MGAGYSRGFAPPAAAAGVGGWRQPSTEGDQVPSVAFCVPIIPGKEETDRKGFEEAAGPRREEFDASRRRAGITREMVWHQATPDGTVAVVYLEADDIPASMQALATSDDPFDRWFRELLKEVHGIDLKEGGPTAELVLEATF